MMGGQICSEDLTKDRSGLDRARKFYQRGLRNCPNSVVLWCLASRLEERVADYGAGSANAGVTKARSLLELARLMLAMPRGGFNTASANILPRTVPCAPPT